jgi:hypothetical protein
MGNGVGRSVMWVREMEGRPARRFSIWARSWVAGDVDAGGFGVGGEGGGADEVAVDDVLAEDGVVAVAEGVEEVGVGHEEESVERSL